MVDRFDGLARYISSEDVGRRRFLRFVGGLGAAAVASAVGLLRPTAAQAQKMIFCCVYTPSGICQCEEGIVARCVQAEEQCPPTLGGNPLACRIEATDCGNCQQFIGTICRGPFVED